MMDGRTGGKAMTNGKGGPKESSKLKCQMTEGAILTLRNLDSVGHLNFDISI
jgi:hypothetical protein